MDPRSVARAMPRPRRAPSVAGMSSTPDSARDPMRVSDRDREQVAAVLRDAVGTGRLTLTEFDERLRAAYAAVTRDDLAGLVADLPRPQPATAAPAAVAIPSTARAEQWRSWAGGALLLVGIWATTSLIAGNALFFWPAIPIVIWAVSLVAGGNHHGCATPTSRT